MVYQYIRRYFGIGEGADSLGFVAPPLPAIDPYAYNGNVKREMQATSRGYFQIGRELPPVNIDAFGFGFYDQIMQQPLADLSGGEK